MSCALYLDTESDAEIISRQCPSDHPDPDVRMTLEPHTTFRISELFTFVKNVACRQQERRESIEASVMYELAKKVNKVGP